MRLFRLKALSFVWLFLALPVSASELRIAVASNFLVTAKSLIREFEENSDYIVKVSAGSTGKHYAQIVNGAPFDVFLAADAERPQLLEKQGIAKLHSRFTYAIGQLVLWSKTLPALGQSTLADGGFRYLAIPNPKLAPYGRAAEEALKAMNLWAKLESQLVRGENVNQTFQYVSSGNAELGMVAKSQVRAAGAVGVWWSVPESLYSPIEQQAVLLSDNAAAEQFLLFLKSEKAQWIIQRHGYKTINPGM